MLRIFRHYIPRSFLFLVFSEFLVFLSAIYFGYWLRFASEVVVGEGVLFLQAVVFAVVMIGAMAATGLYKSTFREGMEGMLIRLGISMLFGLIAMMVLFYIFPSLFLGRGAFAIAFLFSVVGVVFVRLMFFRIVGKSILKKRVLVLGAGSGARYFKDLRRKVDQINFSIIGFVHIDGENDEIQDGVLYLDCPLSEYVTKRNIHEIVIAVEDRRKTFPVDDLLDCKMRGIEVVDVMTFFERETGKIRLDMLQPSWMIFSDGFQVGVLQALMKRGFDIAASSLILAITWPLMLGAAIAIWVESGFKGPIFYRQVRVGQGGREIEVMKFRSMKVDAEKDGVARWAKKNDDRITRSGKFLRRSRIDELPQIINVLRGDMSFVGPRPERPQFVEQLSESIPYYPERHRVKPGITGWAQVRYPYGASEKDALEKLQYDLYYVKNCSLFLDCLILMQTAEVVLFGEGVH